MIYKSIRGTKNLILCYDHYLNRIRLNRSPSSNCGCYETLTFGVGWSMFINHSSEKYYYYEIKE